MSVTLDPTHALLLAVAGVGGGMLSSVVGGGGIVTFPALLTTGMSPLVATASNLMALTPAFLIAVAGERTQLPPLDRSFAALVATSILGSAFGAALLLLTPERWFTALIPLLMAIATVMFALAGRISAWLTRRTTWKQSSASEEAAGQAAQKNDLIAPTRIPPSFATLLPVCIYGGYFGGGAAVMLLAVLTIATRGDYRAANVLKNLMACLNSLTASAIFAFNGNVDWAATSLMVLGTLLGGYAGSHLIRIMPRPLMRIFVIAIGVWLTGYYVWIYWV